VNATSGPEHHEATAGPGLLAEEREKLAEIAIAAL
jgi:hypothetical protein